MLQNSWFSRVVTPRKVFLGVFILLLNAFVWYYMSILVVDAYLRIFSLSAAATLVIWVTYYGAVIAACVIGSIISRMPRIRLLYLWMILGMISSFLPALSFIPPQVWSLALGFALGLGLPACLAYFADQSTIEKRGKTGGIIFLSFSLSAALLAVAFTQLDLTVSVFISALWRILGLLVFIPLKTDQMPDFEKKKRVSFREAIGDRSLRLYLAPWVMFLLIDRFEWSLWGRNLDPSLNTVAIIGPILGSFAALIGGVLSDRIGRKRIVIGGFAALGLAYGVVGLAPNMLVSNVLVSWYLYIAVDGIAWGVLCVAFLLILWGDLSQHGGREKYYLIGAAPYFLTAVIDSISTVTVPEIPAAYTYAFSLASLFLFIAVLPLLFVPETLPEKKIEIRRLRGYLDQARKIREKY
jgi:MFS family permease